MTLTLDREGMNGKYLMSTCILFLLPFSTTFGKVWILLLKKPNSHWSRVNAWVNFWQLNISFLCKSESYWPPNWIHQATTVGNNTENTITMNFRTQIELQFCLKKAVMLPYYLSPHDLLLQQCCTQNGKRSIKGSLLTSSFCKCYGLVNDSWRSSVFNCSCNSNVKWLHETKNENKWKSFERKTALKNKKKRNTSCLKHK